MKNYIRPFIKKIVVAYVIIFAIYNLGNFETSNIMLGAMFVIIAALLCGEKFIRTDIGKRQKKVSAIVAAIWTLSYCIYAGDTLKNGLSNKAFACFNIILSVAGIFALSYIAVSYIVVRQSDASCVKDCEKNKDRTFNVRIWLFYSGIILLCMLPLFLLNFPGTMTVDSFDQLSQARGLSLYSDHHPWVHTLIIELFYSIGYCITGSVTAGIGTYTIAQMIIVALSVGYAAASMDELGFNRKWQFVILIGYIIYPYHLAYVITMWKDIIFSAGVLVFGVTLYRIIVCHVRELRDMVLFAFSSLMICLLRHNGFYAYILTIIILSVVLIKDKKNDKNLGIIISSIAVIIITLVINGPVQKACGVVPGDYGHNIAIPLQQIGRVVSRNGDISAEELNKLEKINSIQYIKNNYEPYCADNMIQWLVAGDSAYMQAHKGEYLGLWIKAGLKNPVAYLDAFTDQTKGYYTTMMPEQIAYYGILPNNDKLEPKPLVGAKIRVKINELCSKLQEVLPVYAIFYSVGACVLLLILGIGIVICRGQYKMLLVYMPYIALILSIIVAAPLVADLRYGYSLMLSMPTLIVMTIGTKK